MSFDNLTPDQKERIKTCTTQEELLEFAKQEGVELSEEELESISGGKAVKRWNDGMVGSCRLG